MGFANEPGNLKTLISLGGVEGRKNLGRVCEINNRSLAGGLDGLVLTANPRRISAIIQCRLGTADAYISFADINYYATFHLRAGESLQIDENFPWIGEVRGCGVINQANVTVFEISVP